MQLITQHCMQVWDRAEKSERKRKSEWDESESRLRLEERESKRGVEGDGQWEMKSKRVQEGETGVASQAEKAVSLYKRSPLSD